MARRTSNDTPSKTDMDKCRSFSNFYDAHLRPKLLVSAAAYTHITPPPYARDGIGEPDYQMLAYRSDAQHWRGRWIDNRVGAPVDRNLAERAWELNELYRLRDGIPLPHARSHYSFTVELNDEATRVEYGNIPDDGRRPMVSVSLPASGYNPAGSSGAAFRDSRTILDETRSNDVPFLSDSSSENESMVEWVSGVVLRRREAFSALCFLQMIAGNGVCSTASIFRQFPDVKQTALALGVSSEIMHAASLPWRGHNDDLAEYIMDAAPPPAGVKAFSWVRWNIQTELRRIATLGLGPTLSKMITAKHAYGKYLPRDPQGFHKITRPWFQGDTAAFNLPIWLRRYHNPVTNNGAAMLMPHEETGFWNDTHPYKTLMRDMAYANAR